MPISLVINCTTKQIQEVEIEAEIKPQQPTEEIEALERQRKIPSYLEFMYAFYESQKGDNAALTEWVKNMDKAKPQKKVD